MTQTPLFFEDVFDVLRAAVQAAGGAKAVAGRLWPHKPIAEAQRELLDCLNRERPRKLCPEEVIVIFKFAKEAGFHGAKHWLDVEMGYQPTAPSDPKIERDRLAEELAKAAEQFKNLTRAAERLIEPAALKAVK